MSDPSVHRLTLPIDVIRSLDKDDVEDVARRLTALSDDWEALCFPGGFDLTSGLLLRARYSPKAWSWWTRQAVNPNRVRSTGETGPWHWAAMNFQIGKLKSLSKMAQRFNETPDLTRVSKSGKTPLAEAFFPSINKFRSFAVDQPVITWLLEQGADVNVKIKGVPLLLALLKKVVASQGLSSKPTFKFSPSLYIPKFLAHGLDVNAASDQTGETLSHFYANLSKGAGLSWLRTLAEHHADFDRPDAKGQTVAQRMKLWDLSPSQQEAWEEARVISERWILKQSAGKFGATADAAASMSSKPRL